MSGIDVDDIFHIIDVLLKLDGAEVSSVNQKWRCRLIPFGQHPASFSQADKPSYLPSTLSILHSKLEI